MPELPSSEAKSETAKFPFSTQRLLALKPKSAPYEVRDAAEKGLRLRVSPTGVKSFRWICTARRKVYTLGIFGDGTAGTLTLSDARKKLETYKEKHRAGVDPEGSEAGSERPRTVGQLCDVWYRESIKLRRDHPENVLRVIDNDIKPTIGTLPLIAVDTLAARRPVRHAIDRKALSHAGTVLQQVKQLFSWAESQGFMEKNPARSLKADDFGIVNNVCERWLSAVEIPIAVKAIDGSEMEPAVRLGLKFLLFTGLRTNEALTLRRSVTVDRVERSDIDLEAKTVTVRPENRKLTKKQREKGAGPFVQPLSPPAVAIVEELCRLAPDSPWLFASDQSDSGHLSEKCLARALRRLWRKNDALSKLPEASPHDFRRTMATHMSDTLGLPPHVGQLCIAHQLNRVLGSGVAATYDHAKRLEERRAALEAYATWIEGLLTGATAEVFPIAAAKKGAA